MQLFKMILDTFGSATIVPVIVFILSCILRVKPKDAFKGALYMGVGLVAFNVILGALTGSIGGQIATMVESTGLDLPGLDVGWAAGAVIVYANTIGMAYLGIGLVVQLAMFLANLTDSFQPTDIWNYYNFIFWAAIVQFQTGNFGLAVACGVFINLIVLLLADLLGPSISEHYGYDGVTSTCFAATNGAPFAILMKWILTKIGILGRIHLDPDSLRERLGFWGEPMAMGLIIGMFISFIANFKNLGQMATWATIITTGLTTGAILSLYPAVSGMFVRGLTPISSTMQRRVRSGEIKRKRFFIALDPAVFFGESANLTSGLLMIPIMVAMSFLPGNKMIPLADLAAMPFMMIGITAVFKGDIFGTVLTGAIWYTFGQTLNSTILEIFTQAATTAGFETQGATLISAWSLGVVPFGWMSYKAFVSGAVGIAIAVIIYLVVYILFRKNKSKWQIAAGATEEYMQEQGFLDA